MKKFFLALAVLACTTFAFGKADEKQLSLVEKGGIEAIFNSGVKANLVYEFDKNCTASYQGTSAIPLKQYIELNKEWDEEWAEASEGFTEDWNKRNKKGMTIAKGDAEYTIKVTIDGFKEMAGFGVWWEITSGKVEIIENASKKAVVSYKIHEYYESCSGFKAMKLRNRIKETLAGLSESCLVFAKKAK